MKRILILLVGSLLWFATTPVLACSGGTDTPLLTLLENAEVVVKARVLDVDAYGQTGVVEVIENLAGSRAGNLLLVSQLGPVSTSYTVEDRHGSGGCATLGISLTLDEDVYLFLSRNRDGSYRTTVLPSSFSIRTNIYRFPQPDSVAPLITGNPDDRASYVYQTVNEDEFRAVLLEHLPETPAALEAAAYPMPAPMLITTTSDTAYLVPVDYSEPVLLNADELRTLRRSSSVWRRGNPLGVTGCNTVGCTAYAPNGHDSASVEADGVRINEELVPGVGFLFSWTNEAIAVWTETSLNFFTFRYPRLDLNEYQTTALASIPIKAGTRWAAEAAWSRDGRLLAYSDRDGLWLLDVYSQRARLLLPINSDGEVPTARYFSQGGRYLAITQGSQRNTLDLVSTQTLPDGLFSPNERFFIAYDSAALQSVHWLCTVTTPTPCQELGPARDTVWLDNNRYMGTYCPNGTGSLCAFGAGSIGCCGTPHLGEGLAFDYEPVTATFLVVRNRHQVDMLDGYHGLTYDLSRWVNEEIRTAEWLPALYADSRTFSPIVIERYLKSLPPV